MVTSIAPGKPTLVEPTRKAILLTGAIGLAGAAYVTLLDPTKRSLFAPCPLHAATGIWCPGCGLTRGVHALLHGHLATSMGFNLFAPLVVVGVAYWWIANAIKAFTGRRPPVLIRNSRVTTIVMLSLALVFTIVRNTSAGRALAP
jgi:type IV secretory pathway TrbD component